MLLVSNHLYGSSELENETKEDIVHFFDDLTFIIRNIEQKSPELLLSKEYIKEASANKLIADSNKGIKVNFSLGSQSIYENRPGQSYYQSYRTVGSVFIKKPIFHWGAINAKSRIAELSLKYSQEQSKLTKLNLINEVRSEFTDLVLLNYQLELEKKTYQFAVENEDELTKRKDVGLNTELDVSEATIKKLEQALKIAETERLLGKKRAFFKIETGYSNDLNLSIPSSFVTMCKNHKFGEKIPIIVGAKKSNEIEQLKTLIDTENQNIIVAESALKPKVNLIGGFYQDQIDLPEQPDSVRRNNFLIGIEANWALWDSSFGKGQKSLALAKKRRYEIQLETSVRKLRLEIESLKDELFNVAEQIALSRRLLKSAQQRNEISEIKFNQNQITTNDLLSAKINLNKAELSLLESVFRYFSIKEQYQAHLTSSHSKS